MHLPGNSSLYLSRGTTQKIPEVLTLIPVGAYQEHLTLTPAIPKGGFGHIPCYGAGLFSAKDLTHYHFLMLSPFFSTTSFMRLAIEPTRFCGATYPLTALMHFFWKSSKLSSSCSICLKRFSAFGQTFSCGLRSGLCHAAHNYLNLLSLA